MAKIFLRLSRGGQMVAEEDLFGTFDRGEDMKYIHQRELKTEKVV